MKRRQQQPSERGSVAVIVAMALTAMMGLAALGTDVGRMYVERQRLHSLVDAATLAGAQRLPVDPNGAVAKAREYLQKNRYDPSQATIALSDSNSRITVTVNSRLPMTFARVIGVAEVPVEADAQARTAALSGYQGAVPLGVPREAWQLGQSVTLRLDADTGAVSPGNYMALALGRTGSSTYEANLMYGYNDWLRANQWIPAETGNMANPTVRGLTYRINQDPYATYLTVKRQSPRLVVVPIVAGYNTNGRGEVNIVGFAMFFIESVRNEGNNKGAVTGRFVQMVAEGEFSSSAPNYGVYVTKLVR